MYTHIFYVWKGVLCNRIKPIKYNQQVNVKYDKLINTSRIKNNATKYSCIECKIMELIVIGLFHCDVFRYYEFNLLSPPPQRMVFIFSVSFKIY